MFVHHLPAARHYGSQTGRAPCSNPDSSLARRSGEDHKQQRVSRLPDPLVYLHSGPLIHCPPAGLTCSGCDSVLSGLPRAKPRHIGFADWRIQTVRNLASDAKPTPRTPAPVYAVLRPIETRKVGPAAHRAQNAEPDRKTAAACGCGADPRATHQSIFEHCAQLYANHRVERFKTVCNATGQFDPRRYCTEKEGAYINALGGWVSQSRKDKGGHSTQGPKNGWLANTDQSAGSSSSGVRRRRRRRRALSVPRRSLIASRARCGSSCCAALRGSDRFASLRFEGQGAGAVARGGAKEG